MLISTDHLNLRQIAQSGQCFRWRETEDHGFEIPAFGKVLTVRQRADDRIEADCTEDEWQAVWRNYFDLDTDYGAMIARIPPEDEYLLAAAAHGGGIRILRQPLWETVVSFIISQNNNIPRIRGIVDRLCFGQDDFPAPAAIAAMGEKGLRAAGLGYRAPYLTDAAMRFSDGNEEGNLAAMDYPHARAHLTRYHGVGGKVADCICLYGLHHLEAFPMDKWMKQIEKTRYAGHFPMDSYAGVQGVMQQYMFYYERCLAAVPHLAGTGTAAILP